MIIKQLLIILLSVGYIKSCNQPQYFSQDFNFMQWIHSSDENHILSRHHHNGELYVVLCEIYTQSKEIDLVRNDIKFKQYYTLLKQQSKIDPSLTTELNILQNYNPFRAATLLSDVQNYRQKADDTLQKYRTWKNDFKN